jgi:mono/diheme cytochrome c family protein
MTAEPAGDFDEEFYLHHLASQDRTGFIWQKLKEPRSYDFMKARNKDYNERLRMPHFPLTNEQREQMITFVLGLVAEPPAYEFVYHPEGRRQAIIEGQKVVTDYNCAACHVLDAAEWNIAFKPGDIAPPQIPPTYPFVETHFSESTLTASATPDPVRGTLSATLKGLPSITNEDARPMIFDEEGFPLEEGQKYDPAKLQYMFDLWVPTAIDGKTYEVGPQPLGVMAGMIKEQFPPHGGDLSFRLLPRVLEIEKQTTPAAKGREAWGWVAPPLIGEGKKVQPEWLHAFLLDPHVIRPAAFLRMPKFNMSPQEASAIVNYFAAKDDADYPYQFIPRTRPEHLAEKESEYRERAGTKDPDEAHSSGSVRLDAAMNIVTSGDYCIQCHLVADFRPKGSPRALAPDLSHVYERLRADYVRHWVANPPNILPYTGMPVNIPFVANAENLGGIKQELFRGTSLQQLDGLVDLLMNYNRYTSGRSVISPLIKLATPAATAGSSPAANPVAVIDHE